jgi:hypothetical protein
MKSIFIFSILFVLIYAQEFVYEIGLGRGDITGGPAGKIFKLKNSKQELE